MPGIITHAVAFFESLEHLKRKKQQSFKTRSIEALFGSEEHLRAGLFGTLGPNIFDYNPFRRARRPYGSILSFLLHNDGASTVAGKMLDRIIAMHDFNNEWASTQRAYFYGYISHLICDTIFHPFVFYFSGFPKNMKDPSPKEVIFFREQNLMFQYNLDGYFEHFFKDRRFHLDLNAFFPNTGKGFFTRLSPAVKEFVLGSIEEAFPNKIRRLIFKSGPGNDRRFSESFGFLDLCPKIISLVYAVKRAKTDSRIVRVIREIRRRKLVYSDFFVLYPPPRKINKHLANLHRDRWRSPSGTPGWRYESVEDLLHQVCAATTETWEKVEGILYGEKKNYQHITRRLSANPLTGEIATPYEKLKVYEAVTVRY